MLFGLAMVSLMFVHAVFCGYIGGQQLTQETRQLLAVVPRIEGLKTLIVPIVMYYNTEST